jgi:hypothetical protein
MIQLDSSYSVAEDGSVTMHVSQLPPNPNIMTPGPAWMFVLCNGVPSIATEVMLGSGKIEKQSILPVQELPTSTVNTAVGSHAAADGTNSNSSDNTASNNTASTSAGSRVGITAELLLGATLLGLLFW